MTRLTNHSLIELCEQYDCLFIGGHAHASCGPGWYNLLRDMFEELKFLQDRERLEDPLYCLAISDIKEKYGSLSVYTHNGTDEMMDVIEKYEELSYGICEGCGEPGETSTPYSYWISVKCDNCRGFSNKEARTISMLGLLLTRLDIITWEEFRELCVQMIGKLQKKFKDGLNEEERERKKMEN